MRQLAPLQRFAVAFALTAATACSAVSVTPDALREARIPPAEREELATTWNDAVARCNEFLASPFRRALPPGTVVLDDARGMSFVGDERTWPLEVRSTSWGDVVLWFGFQAQERTSGFTVGECPPERDRVADNSLFRDSHGFAMSSDIVADLILHEATHVVSGEGALGFWKSFAYYCEALFLFRYGPTHSDERLAYGTNEEYHAFIQSVGRSDTERERLLDQLDAHIAEGAKKSCRHALPAEESSSASTSSATATRTSPP
jgi:hypothetical protein